MNTERKFLVETLAEYAERNLFTSEELERLIRICLQLERDYPGVPFVISEGNADSVERNLRRQEQILNRPRMSQEDFNNNFSQAWA